ncbi:MAG: hypothetical protein M3O34_02720, partial [Chloroflexota bacterium]|nr:hypothetical protein [Chloroflexota bacterium]
MIRTLRALVVALLVALACGRASSGVTLEPGGRALVVGVLPPNAAHAQAGAGAQSGPDDRDDARWLP